LSQQGRLVDIVSALITLTGNVGGPVPSDGLGDINVIGTSPLNVTGNPGTFTLTIANDGGLAESFVTDSGTAIPNSTVLNVLGDSVQGSSTSGAGSTITITNSNATTTQKGVLETATDVEAIAAASATISVVPSNLNPLFASPPAIGGTLPSTAVFTQLDVDNIRIDTNTISSQDANGPITLLPNGTGGVVIPTDLTIGDPMQSVGFTINGSAINAVCAVHTEGVTDLGGFVTQRHSDTAVFGAHTIFLRSRGTEATATIVSDNDSLLRNISAGYDGVDYAQSAEIAVQVDGVPGIDDMPGRIVLLTSASGSQTPLEGFRLDSSQVVTLANALTVPNGGTGATNLTDGGILLGSGTGTLTATAQPTNGQLLIGSTGVDPTLSTLTAGTGITITDGSGSITIDSTGGGHDWQEIVGTSATMVINTGYIANNAALVTLTLPATAIQGSIIHVVGKGAGLWKIALNAGQTIYYGSSTTTTGVGGSLTATKRRDGIEMVCITADTEWQQMNSVGNITVT